MSGYLGTTVSLEKATDIYLSMPAEKRIPILHPRVVHADSFRDSRYQSAFWQFSRPGGQALKCFHLVTSFIEGSPAREAVVDIESAYGYGGVLCSSGEETFLREMTQAFSAWADENRILAEFSRLHPLLLDQPLCYETVTLNRATVVIDLTVDFFAGYAARRRTYLRKERKKSPELQELSPSTQLALFQRLYEETMSRLRAEKFYYFNTRYFSELVAAPGSRLWGLRYGEGEIQAAMLSLEEPESGIVEYHLGAYHQSSASRPMELLIHLVAEHYRDRGFRKFFLGGGRSSQENDGLLQFKRGFSCQELPFYIGANIFSRERYQALRDHPGLNMHPEKIIFYRN